MRAVAAGLILLLVQIGRLEGQGLKDGEFVGTWKIFSQTETRVFADNASRDSLASYTRRTCSAGVALSPLDRRPLDSLARDRSASFSFASRGRRARLVRGNEICVDSTLSSEGVKGSAASDTQTVVGVLAQDPDVLLPSPSNPGIVLDLLRLGTGDVRRFRLARSATGRVRGEGSCDKLGQMVTTTRGFGPREECTATTALLATSDEIHSASEAEASTAADSIAAMVIAFQETTDTLLWLRAALPSSTIRDFLLAASFPRSLDDLRFHQILAGLARFADGSNTTRQMLQNAYRLAPESQRQALDAARKNRADLQALIAARRQ